VESRCHTGADRSRDQRRRSAASQYPGITHVWTWPIKKQLPEGYSHVIVMEFASEDALKNYADSPAQRNGTKPTWRSAKRAPAISPTNSVDLSPSEARALRRGAGLRSPASPPRGRATRARDSPARSAANRLRQRAGAVAPAPYSRLGPY
jgi:hypothetical protein